MFFPIKLFVALASAAAAFPALAQSGLTNLGTLGGGISAANGVSANGAVVVGESLTTNNAATRAFRWTGNVMTDLGTLGGTNSSARGVSADGAVVVGESSTAGDAATRAFRWTGNGMTDLGTLGGTSSWATGVSADGAVVVGYAQTAGNANFHAFRWTGNGMFDLGTLGGTRSTASGVSADGAVVVGYSHTAGNAAYRAFRWTGNVMTDLGTLGGANSWATGVSADGAVVVGESSTTDNAASHAFRWTGNGMIDLGTLGGTRSWTKGVSADGAVVVGYSQIAGDATTLAFRWTQAGMQTVEDWLRASGVSVPADITQSADGVSGDGSVVVGTLLSGHAFIARVASGLITLSDLQTSLAGTARGGVMALAASSMQMHGAHGRPLTRRVAAGQNNFWLAGDWGTDDHGARDGNLGLAEAGIGRNFGAAQLNVSLGQTWAKQRQALDGRMQSEGVYVHAEALIPVRGSLWAVLGGHVQRGETDIRRGYLNAGAQDYSRAAPDTNTWGVRARLEWEAVLQVLGTGISPYVDLSYSEATLDGFTETGGGFPARFDARKDKATELRLGMHAARPLVGKMNLVTSLEAARRFERDGARTSGEVIGLFGFDLAGETFKQRWLRAGIGVEGKLAEGRASLSLNATTQGEAPSVWLAASWQRAF